MLSIYVGGGTEKRRYQELLVDKAIDCAIEIKNLSLALSGLWVDLGARMTRSALPSGEEEPLRTSFPRGPACVLVYEFQNIFAT
ncbi:hypothetical protein ANO11243_071970 [Dothideomycetidae sp. 11243]|nr:hypothetical protein ANO11243_071970 [fungal sp. No.11243]